MSEKIQKILSNLGYGSRRCIEKKISLGLIEINKKKVFCGERFKYKEIKTLKINKKNCLLKLDKIRVLIYHKSVGEISTRKDEKFRKTIFDNLPKLYFSRWINVGRLDCNTSGLLLFTNYGELAYRLTHPSYQIIREYLVNITGIISQKKINILKKGVFIEKSLSRFNTVKYISGNKQNIWFIVSLRQGKNREVRRLWNYVNIKINKLIRIRFGNVFLPKLLKIKNYLEVNNKNTKKILNLVSL